MVDPSIPCINTRSNHCSCSSSGGNGSIRTSQDNAGDTAEAKASMVVLQTMASEIFLASSDGSKLLRIAVKKRVVDLGVSEHNLDGSLCDHSHALTAFES